MQVCRDWKFKAMHNLVLATAIQGLLCLKTYFILLFTQSNRCPMCVVEHYTANNVVTFIIVYAVT